MALAAWQRRTCTAMAQLPSDTASRLAGQRRMRTPLMNDRRQEAESEFNSPAEMRARAVYLLYIGSVATGLASLFLGAVVQQPRLSATGVIALALAWWARDWLKR